MTPSKTSLTPHEARRRIVDELIAAELPIFASAEFDPELNWLVVAWDHGPMLGFDLTMGSIPEFDDAICEEIRGLRLLADGPPIDITVPGSPDDPRAEIDIPGVNVHHVPELHPDDVTVHRGLRVTTPSRTLIDMAEVVSQDELRELFRRADELGMLDADALRASRARVEWRPSLEMLDEVIEEFCGPAD